jgi:hypothetical protein
VLFAQIGNKQKEFDMNKILICTVLQLVLFIPFYLIWLNDCKTIGKENLAVSLSERFITWLIICPIWIFGILD